MREVLCLSCSLQQLCHLCSSQGLNKEPYTGSRTCVSYSRPVSGISQAKDVQGAGLVFT